LFPGVPGIVDAATNPLDSGLPRVSVSGYASLGGSNNNPAGRITNTYELSSNVTKVAPFGWNRHTVKFGYGGRREEARRFLDGASRGSLTFADCDQFAGTCAHRNAQSLLFASTSRTGDTRGHWPRYAAAYSRHDDAEARTN